MNRRKAGKAGGMVENTDHMSYFYLYNIKKKHKKHIDQNVQLVRWIDRILKLAMCFYFVM